jgi:hypothetical protein
MLRSCVYQHWCQCRHTRGILDRPWTCMVADTFLIVLIVRCFRKTVYFLFFHWYNFVTVSPLSSKTNNCYNITSVFFIIYLLSSESLISWIVFIFHRKIFPIHHTYIYSLVSYLFYKTRPNDFDLQLGCCISDAFSIFYIIYFIIQYNIELIFANTSIIEYWFFFRMLEHFFPGIALPVSILLLLYFQKK